MASSVINCIDYALFEVEWMVERADRIHEQKMFKVHSFLFTVLLSEAFDRVLYLLAQVLRFRLSNLEAFVLSARILGTDASLGPFLERIKDIVRRNAAVIQRHIDELLDGSPDIRLDMRVAFEFRKDIQSMGEEMDGWYMAMLDCRQTSPLVADQVLEILSSVLLNLEDFQSFRSTILHAEILGEALENLGEHVKFLESLICFATLISDQLEQKLLARAEAVAIKFAHLLFTCRVDKFDAESGKKMQHSISTLVQMIKPVDPQVYDAYTQALCSFKLSTRLMPSTKMDDDALISMKNFLNSLISILWEILRVDSSAGDQLQQLYEGLRSLRTILEKQSRIPGMSLNEDIEAVVCDAGVLICSLHRTDIELDLKVSNVSKAITSILSSRINKLGFVDFVLDKLAQLRSGKSEPLVKESVGKIQVELRLLRNYMRGIVELGSQQVELQKLWDRVLDMAYIIDCLIVHKFSDSLQVESVLKDISVIKADVLRTYPGLRRESKVTEENEIYRHQLSPKVPLISDEEFVGFEDDVRSILGHLTRGSRDLQIVTLAGMPGSGKTTLAAKILNEVSIKQYFHLCARCCISHVMDKKKVLLDLLNQVHPGFSSAMPNDDLETKLYKSLKGNRYLIVLDDIWDVKAWDDLKFLFPDDKTGSRIITTSRQCDIVREPHFVRQMNRNESMQLLQRKLPQTKWLLASLDLQMQIVEKCHGLPLTIIIVAELLATIVPRNWEKVVRGLNSHVLRRTNAFELSYKYLPDYLKPCLLYFGALPKGQEVSVRRLVRLWMAEGFVQERDQESQENVAERYLNSLICRSLIVVSKKRSIGGVKSCRVHDLLYAFCLQKAKDEHFFHFLKGHGELSAFNEPRNLQRLCIHSELKHFKESKLFCPRARSLLFSMSQRVHRAEVPLDISFVIHIFKLLRVLDLQQICLDSGLPSEIELLLQLAFLAIRGKMRLIPSSIAKLSNLETLIVDAGRHGVSLPDSLWNLQKLKYVYIKSFENFGGGSLSTQNAQSSFILYELDRFSGAVFPSWGSMEKMMTKIPKIRKLKCMLNFELGDDARNHDFKTIDLHFLHQLESLHVSPYGGLPFDGMFEFSLPSSLKKLTLSHFYLAWSNISTIGALPHLEFFKLLNIIFEGETWEMVEGEFSELRILTLSSCLDLVSWKSGDNQLPCLEKLVFNECEYLEELPNCLRHIGKLQMIEISNCPETLADLVKEVHLYGSSDFEITIRSSKEFSVTP